MKSRIITTAAIGLLLAHPGKAEDMTSPFTIPPSGKPEQLLQGIDLPGPTAVAFDSRNRPYLANSRNPEDFGLIHTLRDGQWVTLSPRDAMPPVTYEQLKHMHGNGELVIDDVDNIYFTQGGMLYFSSDYGDTFRAYSCRGSLELRTGHNGLSRPPAISLITNGRYPDREKAKWARIGTLSVLLPEQRKRGLDLGEPILITDTCMAAGSGGHSGGTSFAVTTSNLTHLVYSGITDDLVKGGNPIYIATVDRSERQVVAREFLVNAPPRKADVHTRPTITVDSKGYLHVLTGSHGEPFLYLRSLKPGTITAGWTEPATLSGRQCYASLVCDDSDRLHTVFREWRPHASLGHQSCDAARGNWSKSQTLVHGALEQGKYEYGIFYHRLFIDRASTLYVAFTFFEFGTDKDGDYPEALAVSRDGGKSWRLAGRAIFAQSGD